MGRDYRIVVLQQATRYLVAFLIVALSIKTAFEYQGQIYIYILFTVVSNLLLYYGLRDKAIFFDTFIALFLWLGFWLKLSVRVAFMNGEFSQATGSFDGLGESFDQALLVSICGMLGLIVASVIREKYVFQYPEKLKGVSLEGLYHFYLSYRKLILLTFVVLIIVVAVTNAYFGFYQRGMVPRTVLPFGLNGIYTWLLLFGLASVVALLLHFEFERNKKTSYLLLCLALFETFLSNVSLLSRGMILNASALGLGISKSLKVNNIHSNLRFLFVGVVVFVMLFGGSVLWVNYLRYSSVDNASLAIEKTKNSGLLESVMEHNDSSRLSILFLDRWVGIEGVLAVSSYEGLGWGLWKKAWQERFTYEESTTFYDVEIINSNYQDANAEKYHYVNLPGVIAFCFYPGSFLFLFCGVLVLGLLGALVEVSVYYIGGKNIILCALFAQVVAYRLASFGYVPIQGYMLFGTIYLNLGLIYFADKGLLFWQKRQKT